MKNTARRVGAPRGAGGRAARPPREAQERKLRARHPAGRGTPCRIKKCHPPAGDRAGGQGGKPRRAADEGKPPDTLHAKHRASRKKPPEGHRCADRRERPRRGRALWRAGRSRRRSPTRATAPKGRKSLLCDAGDEVTREGWGRRMLRSRTNEKTGDGRRDSPRRRGRGRFRKPPGEKARRRIAEPTNNTRADER